MYRINYDLISKSQLRTGKLYLHNIKIINKFRRTISYLHFDLGGGVTCKINTALENFTSKILTWLFKRSKYMYIPCGVFFVRQLHVTGMTPAPPPPTPPTHQYFNVFFFDRDRKTNNSHYYKQHIESMVLLAEKMKKKRLDI